MRPDRGGIARARAFIDRHYAQPLTIPRLARVAGLSPSHFIRAFQAQIGTTPHQYIRGRNRRRARAPAQIEEVGKKLVLDVASFGSQVEVGLEGDVGLHVPEPGVALREIDIRAACTQHLTDIGVSPDDRSSVVFENTQARERTIALFRQHVG